MYHCAACLAVVAVLSHEGRTVLVRSCECDAAILADMSTTLEGHSDVGAG